MKKKRVALQMSSLCNAHPDLNVNSIALQLGINAAKCLCSYQRVFLSLFQQLVTPQSPCMPSNLRELLDPALQSADRITGVFLGAGLRRSWGYLQETQSLL